jgi:hypothetical protein
MEIVGREKGFCFQRAPVPMVTTRALKNNKIISLRNNKDGTMRGQRIQPLTLPDIWTDIQYEGQPRNIQYMYDSFFHQALEPIHVAITRHGMSAGFLDTVLSLWYLPKKKSLPCVRNAAPREAKQLWCNSVFIEKESHNSPLVYHLLVTIAFDSLNARASFHIDYVGLILLCSLADLGSTCSVFLQLMARW